MYLLIILLIGIIIRIIYYSVKNRNRNEADEEQDERLNNVKNQNESEKIDVILLKNGTTRKGTIIENIPNEYIKIKTLEGYFYVDKINEIEKISNEDNMAYKQNSTKRCPYCKEEINIDAIKCRYCGEILDNTIKANRKKSEEIKKTISLKWPISTFSIVCFILSASNPSQSKFEDYLANNVLTVDTYQVRKAENAGVIACKRTSNYFVFSVYTLTIDTVHEEFIGVFDHFVNWDGNWPDSAKSVHFWIPQ